ncbi:hypothetical protein JCM18902_539 [Psychrobacter sp. JCM 18902]|nr:hypothetical protein JCM18902_539 [Psychrobacter sp. JCM 18902]
MSTIQDHNTDSNIQNSTVTDNKSAQPMIVSPITSSLPLYISSRVLAISSNTASQF